MSIAKRIIAMVMSLIIIIGLLPFSAFAAEGDANVITNINSFYDPENKGKEPAQLNTAGHPYGDNNYFNLAPQHELMKIYTGGEPGSADNDAWVTESFKVGVTEVNDYTNAGNLIAHIENPVHEWSYLQAIGFDPEGVGRDTHIAYVGYDPGSKAIKVGVYDVARQKAAVGPRWQATASWIADADGHSLMQFNAYNFMSITAGDYDGDGKETFVVFGSGDGDKVNLTEWYFSASKNEIYQQATSSSLLHQSYMRNASYNSAGSNAGKKLGADLATGDFDGDHIDDLAVVSFIGAKGKYDSESIDGIAPYLAVALGRGSGDHIVNQTSGNLSASGLGGLATINEAGNKLHFPTAPSITAGNMDGDNADEIVVAGYRFELSGSNLQKSLKNASGNFLDVRVTAFDITGDTIKRNHYSSMGVNKLTEHNIVKFNKYLDNTEKDFAFAPPQVAAEFVRTNGAGVPEDLFLNGTFMKYDKETKKWITKFNEDDFNDSLATGGWQAQIGFITNVSAGVFTDNELGREQIAYTVWFKDGESRNLIGTKDNADDYSIMMGISGGKTYNDKENSYGEVTKYGTSGMGWLNGGFIGAGGQVFFNEQFDCTDKKNALFVAVDIDKDGILAKYKGKDYSYTDPTVITVLQAAPYYDAFGYLDECQTSYTFETAFAVGQSEARSKSFSVGANLEVETPAVKLTVSSGYSGSWEESFKKEFSETYSTTFKATRDNVVVLQRTPVILYMYLVQKPDGTFSYEKDPNGNDSGSYITISIPCEPVYALMTVEEYNSFVDGDLYKNSTPAERRLKPITMEELKQNKGKPENYFNDWPEGATNLSASTYSASNSTGSITSTFSSSESESVEQSTTHGFYFNSSVKAGGGAFGFGAWAGAEVSTENNTTQSTFTTNVSSKTVSGTVGNLGESGLPADMLNSYVFDWQFGSWKMNLGGDANIYAYGYRVMDAKTVDQVTTLKVEDGPGDVESAVLIWDPVEGAAEYTVYIYADGEYTQIATTTDSTYTYQIPADSRQREFVFAVTFTRDGSVSPYSNRVTYYRQSYGMSAYQVAVQNGFVGTVEEWLASLVGADGKEGVGIESITFNNDGEMLVDLTDGTIVNLGVIHGEDGENGLTPYIDENGVWCIGEINTGVKATGADGEDGITPQLRINSETGEWEVSLDNGINWETTGVAAAGEKGEAGEDGVGIKMVEMDRDGNLIITLTNDASFNLGVVRGADGYDGADGTDGRDGADGADGKDGADGADGKDGQDGADGKDGADGSNGTDGRNGINGKDGVDGKDGADGKDGKDGKDGLGIADIKIDENGNFIFTMSDGSIINAGSVPKDDHVKGVEGLYKGGITEEDGNSSEMLAIIAIILSSVSLLWNLFSLTARIRNKKKDV